MDNESVPSRQEAIAAVINAYEGEFIRLEDTWKSLETKAQGTLTVAGLFVGFVLTFTKELPPTIGVALRIFLSLLLVVLGYSLWWGISALRIRRVGAGPGGERLEAWYEDLFQQPPGDREATWIALQETRVIALRELLDDRAKKNDEKAEDIAAAQRGVATAVVVAALIAFYMIWAKGHGPAAGGNHHGEVHQPGVRPAGDQGGLLRGALSGVRNVQAGRGAEDGYE